MSEHEHNATEGIRRIESPGYLSFSKNTILGMVGTAIGGGIAATLASSMYTNGQQRVMLAYLIALAFVLSLSLGSLFFVLIQHLTRAGWAVLVRRPAEVFAMNIVTVAILSVPILWNAFSGEQSIYPWARGPALSNSQSKHYGSPTATTSVALVANPSSIHEPAAATLAIDRSDSEDSHAVESGTSHLYVHQTFDSLTASKTGWLNPPFFLVRFLVYFALWSLIAGFYFQRSKHQDTVGGVDDTRKMEFWSGPAMFLFGITLTYAVFDLLMSLDPHWYSTIFGVYYFAGCAIGGFAVSLLSWLILTRIGSAPAKISDAQFRDLGRLLFAFVFFWGYIAFSQYMLLWYANIPETTRWWVVRGASLAEGYRNSWGIVLVILLFGHFIIPFLGFMSRHVKGNRNAMIFWTVWMLVMHYVDLYWLVMPEFRSSIVFGLPEIGTLAFVGGCYLIGASYIATRTALLPIGDPRFEDSLAIRDAY
jgi:hypothetical protein